MLTLTCVPRLKNGARICLSPADKLPRTADKRRSLRSAVTIVAGLLDVVSSKCSVDYNINVASITILPLPKISDIILLKIKLKSKTVGLLPGDNHLRNREARIFLAAFKIIVFE